jgi:hypothetical protein
MAVKLKKRAIFLMSILFTGILGLWNTYFRSSTPADSLILSIARADAPPACGYCGCNWTDSQCDVYYGDGGGGDGGGCCADASAGGGCGCGCGCGS